MQNFRFPLASRRKAIVAVAGVAVLAAVIWMGRPVPNTGNIFLETPALALEGLHASSLYFNGLARPWLLARRPDLLTEADRSEASDKTRAFAQAVLNPKLFWKLDRQYRFDALLLIGDPSQYRPLIDHLVGTKVWTLRYVDHTSLVFRRDTGRVWQLSDLDPVRQRFAGASSRDRAIFLSNVGVKLVAVRQFDAAKQVLDEAVRLDDKLPEAWNGMAEYRMAKSEWREAQTAVDHALSLDGEFLPALATKTLLLYGARRYSEAYALSGKLISKIPDDPNLLFYHAKIAHEAHAYKTEIEVLLKLIDRAEAENQPLSGYQIYLAQAYAKVGEGQRSIDQFMKALDDPELSDEQRSFARDNILRIKKQTGL